MLARKPHIVAVAVSATAVMGLDQALHRVFAACISNIVDARIPDSSDASPPGMDAEHSAIVRSGTDSIVSDVIVKGVGPAWEENDSHSTMPAFGCVSPSDQYAVSAGLHASSAPRVPGDGPPTSG